MRLGISTGLENKDAKSWAASMKELGLRAVVFPLDSTAPDELIDEYVKEAKENDLLIAEVGVWRNAISLNEEERIKNLDYAVSQLKLADRIGARCCVNVAGSAGEVWDGGYKENFSKETWDKTVAMIQEVIDRANPVNTYFTIEPMPWMFPSSPEQYVKLIEAVNRERFAVHMDIINMITSPDRYFFNMPFTTKCFELLGDKIKSCHMKDVKLLPGYTFQLKECAPLEGSYNLKHYAHLASRIDPDMPMIIEHLDSNEAYRKSVKQVREFLNME